MAQKPTEKPNRTEALILQGEQQLKQAALDFGMQFSRSLRQDIETLIRQLKESSMQGEKIHIEQYYAGPQAKLDELNQQMRQHNTLNL